METLPPRPRGNCRHEIRLPPCPTSWGCDWDIWVDCAGRNHGRARPRGHRAGGGLPRAAAGRQRLLEGVGQPARRRDVAVYLGVVERRRRARRPRRPTLVDLPPQAEAQEHLRHRAADDGIVQGRPLDRQAAD